MASLNNKFQYLILLAVLLILLGVSNPFWEKVSDFYLKWLPSILISIFTTALSGLLLYKVTGNYFDDKKLIFFGIPIFFVLTYVIKFLLF